jgi:hypothetical protein
MLLIILENGKKGSHWENKNQMEFFLERKNTKNLLLI